VNFGDFAKLNTRKLFFHSRKILFIL